MSGLRSPLSLPFELPSQGNSPWTQWTKKEARHWRVAKGTKKISNFEYLDTLWQSNVVGLSGDVPATVFTSQADRDVNPYAPICIGMDYNANINWICTFGAKNSLKRSFRGSITPDSDRKLDQNGLFGAKKIFFSFFQNQSKVIGHSFCNFAADLADGARFCLAWCAQSAEPLNQIGMHQSMKLQKKSGRLEEK